MRQLLPLPPRDPAITMSQLRFWLQFATIGKVIPLLPGVQGRRGGVGGGGAGPARGNNQGGGGEAGSVRLFWQPG